MNNKILQKIIKDKTGSTILMLTILILSSILVVSLVSADIVINGLKASRIQNYSTIAFFAAEAGAERSLNEIRKNNIFDTITCPTPGEFCFDTLNSGAVDECVTPGSCTNFDHQELSNKAEYKIEHEQVGQWTYISSYGSYNDTTRVVKVSFCTPNCAGVNCGVADGCGGNCPPWCEAVFGCQAVAPANSVAVNPGSCCVGACYECAVGFAWDGSACVNSTYCGDGIAQTPNSDGLNELCDGTSPLGGNQECASDCLAIGYGFYMENNTSINKDNVYFTAINSDERYVNITCKGGRNIEIYGVCEIGNIECHTGAVGTPICEIGCSAYNIPGNQSYYQFVCR